MSYFKPASGWFQSPCYPASQAWKSSHGSFKESELYSWGKYSNLPHKKQNSLLEWKCGMALQLPLPSTSRTESASCGVQRVDVPVTGHTAMRNDNRKHQADLSSWGIFTIATWEPSTVQWGGRDKHVYFFQHLYWNTVHMPHTSPMPSVQLNKCVARSWSCATIKQPILRHFRHPKGKSCTSCRSQLPPPKASPSRRQPLTYFLHTDSSILSVS